MTFGSLPLKTFKNITVKSGLTMTFGNVRGNFGYGNTDQSISPLQNIILRVWVLTTLLDIFSLSVLFQQIGFNTEAVHSLQSNYH